MKLTFCMPVLALVLTAAACGASSPATRAANTSLARTATPADNGTVSGTFMRVGGPLGVDGTQPRPVPLMGTVLFSASRDRTVAVTVGKTGRFSLRLPAGRYIVSGRSPALMASGATVDPACGSPVTITVVAHRAVRVSVVCPVP
jgi:hypothetical protein